MSTFAWPKDVPRWEDFKVSTAWNGPSAPLRLVRPDERMFRTRLEQAVRQAPDFAGHYRFAGWGCGSVCAAGAVIDLENGAVYPPLRETEGQGWRRWIFAGGIVSGPFVEFRRDSRLVIVREQDKNPALQQVRYYEWTGNRFRLIRRLLEKKP